MKNTNNDYKELGLFNNGEYLVFSFKKTEKIISAIYLVTNLIKDNEPIKWELREGSMSLLSVSMSLNGSDIVDKSKSLQSFFSLSIHIISLLKIASVSCLISNMNSSMIVDEINLLIEYIKKESSIFSSSAGFILSDSFFATDTLSAEGTKRHDSNQKPSHSTVSFSQKPIVSKDVKESRKNSILAILKKDSNLTIKDFVKVISDCSEKTIQRELIALVEKGIIKRNGERRWSTYSLA